MIEMMGCVLICVGVLQLGQWRRFSLPVRLHVARSIGAGRMGWCRSSSDENCKMQAEQELIGIVVMAFGDALRVASGWMDGAGKFRGDRS